MLFSELNDSKNKVFSRSFTYAAEFNIAVSLVTGEKPPVEKPPGEKLG